MNAIRLKVVNFGPIKTGCKNNDGWIHFGKVTVLIGGQGSGKSTLLKLFKLFSMVEELLVHQSSPSYDATWFLKQLANQKLEAYLRKDSHLEYAGHAFRISFVDGVFYSAQEGGSGFHFPMIINHPVERTLLSVYPPRDFEKHWAFHDWSYLELYHIALHSIKEGQELPVSGTLIEYSPKEGEAFLQGTDYKIKLSEASSGIQSLVPLVLVSDYLLRRILNMGTSHKEEMEVTPDPENSQPGDQVKAEKSSESVVREAEMNYLKKEAGYSCFYHLIEAPELHLYPATLKQVLYYLLSNNNATAANKLIMTTQSPYLLGFLTLALKAGSLATALPEEALSKISGIVPQTAFLKKGSVTIYQLDAATGSVSALETYQDLPSDDNLLNNIFDDSNDAFAKLLEMEHQWQ
jgi:energy-coupling factor transporter ATP-binding protein EcfA2